MARGTPSRSTAGYRPRARSPGGSAENVKKPTVMECGLTALGKCRRRALPFPSFDSTALVHGQNECRGVFQGR